MAAKVKTGPEAIERQQRVAAILQLRLQGWSLREIGEAQTPPVSAVAIFKTIVRALRDMVLLPFEEARKLEAARLDEMLVGVYDRAVNGDVNAVDRALSIHDRRARLMNLYPPRPVAAAAFAGEVDPSKVRLEIVNAPPETEIPVRQKIA